MATGTKNKNNVGKRGWILIGQSWDGLWKRWHLSRDLKEMREAAKWISGEITFCQKEEQNKRWDGSGSGVYWENTMRQVSQWGKMKIKEVEGWEVRWWWSCTQSQSQCLGDGGGPRVHKLRRCSLSGTWEGRWALSASVTSPWLQPWKGLWL